MKRKIIVSRTEDDLLVDFTFHDVSATLLTEFAEKIVRPYYSGNVSAALRDLMQNTIREEDFVVTRVKRAVHGDHG